MILFTSYSRIDPFPPVPTQIEPPRQLVSCLQVKNLKPNTSRPDPEYSTIWGYNQKDLIIIHEAAVLCSLEAGTPSQEFLERTSRSNLSPGQVLDNLTKEFLTIKFKSETEAFEKENI